MSTSGTIMDFKAILVLACVAAGSLAVPVRDSQCALQCNSQDDEGMFRAFKSYYYDYEVTIDSRIDGATSGQTSRVLVEATAVIEGLSACDKVLRLTGVSIKEMREDGTMGAPETASTFTDTLEAQPLRFSMESNGTITSVCPTAGEAIWALNIKRGFLSVIQTKTAGQNEALGQTGIFETSVTGSCMPTYDSEDNSGTKSDDYLMCKNRTTLNMFVDAIPVHLLAPTASPLTSRLECTYENDVQSLTSITCTETHGLKPFAESESQPLTTVFIRLNRKSVTHRIDSSLSTEFGRRTTLLYEDPDSHSHASSQDVIDTMNNICATMATGVGSETPALYESLTNQLGSLDTGDMNTVMSRLFIICSDHSRSFMTMVKDALIDCDSEQCAQGFHTIMQTENSADNANYLKKWFMRLNFHKNPTKNMISLVHRYVSGSSELNVPAYYALSSMIYKYCLTEDCVNDADLMEEAVIFENNLHDSCLPENEEENKKMLISLRAIGNMGLVQSKSQLTRCNRDRNSLELRVASIEAFRRVECENVPTDRFMRIFSTIENDSELRIAAYRGMIRCPAPILLEGIFTTMSQEPTQQVTCYVSSHLANLRDSKNPLLHDLQMAVEGSSLVNVTKCDMDIRKFSHNFGFSRYSEASGNGIHVDSDLIFSSESYIPRNFRLGMNMDLFGYSLDLFELDARLEGWQEALETLVSPPEEDRTTNMVEKLNHFLKRRNYRQKREGVKASALNRINTKYEQNNPVEEEGLSQQAAITMKIMDNDVLYKDQDDLASMIPHVDQAYIMMMIAGLSQQRSHEYSFNKNFKPSRVTIPTLAGMPLQVSIQGALTAHMKASGKLDVMGMAAAPRRMAIVGSLEPSAAIEVQSEMIVDAHCARSGLAHKTNMASSIAMGGSISLENGMFKIQVDAPERRQTLINATSSLYFMQSSDLVPVSEEPENVRVIDVTSATDLYSVHISGTRPIGPVVTSEFLFHQWDMKIFFDKMDQSLTTYDLQVGFTTDKAYIDGFIQKTDRFHILAGAVGSEVIGTYGLDLTYHRFNRTLMVQTDTPYSGVSTLTASLRDEPGVKRLLLRVNHSNEEGLLEAGLDTVPLDSGVEYVPVFNAIIPGIVSYALSGQVRVYGESRRSADWDLNLFASSQKMIGLQGDYETSDTRHSVSTTTTLGPFTGTVNAGVSLEGSSETVLRITPIFSMETSLPASMSLQLGGSPIVVDESHIGINEIYLTTPNTRLVEMSKFHFQKTPVSFGFEGKIKETIPFGMTFNLTSQTKDGAVSHTADLSTTNMLGKYHVEGSLTNASSDHLYSLDVSTDVNDTEYFSLNVDFKNEVNTQHYLDTTISFRGQQLYRSKNGFKIRQLSSKTRYIPIAMLETSRLGNLNVRGSCDVSEDGITVRDMALVGTEDLLTLSGSGGVDRDARRADWSFTFGGAYVQETIEGSASHYQNKVTFNNVITMTDGTEDQPTYSLTLDLSNSTAEDQIFAWDGKVELDISHHQELSFRFDTQYDLSPGRSSGNIVRLCYDGIDCTSTDKIITLGHEFTYNVDRENGGYNHNLEVTFTHPAAGKNYGLTTSTGCYSARSFTSQLHITDNGAVMFETSYDITPEMAPNNGSVIIVFRIPDVYDYRSEDYWRFSDPRNIYYFSQFQSGELAMSFEYGAEISIDEERVPFSYVMFMKYTDIRDNVYAMQDSYNMTGGGNSLRVMTVKNNSVVKMFYHEESVMEISDERIHNEYIYVTRTTFVPIQDVSFNYTFDVDRTNKNNGNLEMRLRFMPDQKPITLLTHFTNLTVEEKKAGSLTTTLSLPKMSITVFTGGQLENGVPSGNLSIKFQPLMGPTTTFGVDLVVNNKSDAYNHNYETFVILHSPDHRTSLMHVVEVNKMAVLPLTSTLTGEWGYIDPMTDTWQKEQVSAALYSAVNAEGNLDSKLTLAIPAHQYALVLNQSLTGSFRNFSVYKDERLLMSQAQSYDMAVSDAGVTYNFQLSNQVMDYATTFTFTLANISNSLSWNMQLQENTQEALYLDWTLNRFPGERKFDVATETRSAYLPGYNTKTALALERTETEFDFTSSLSVQDVEMFSLAITNGSSDSDPNARVTRFIVKQPTNPDLRLRRIVIQDTCSMGSHIGHNITLLWGEDFLPTQIIEMRFRGGKNASAIGASVQLLNPGRVLGFGSHLTVTFGKNSTGYNSNSMVSVYGENGNLFTLEGEYRNTSQAFMKNHLAKITFSRANKQPISIETTLVANDSRTVLDADLVISYNSDKTQDLSAGIDITRLTNGHSITLNLQHLINTIDVSIMGSYSNSSDKLELTLENSVRLGDTTAQPEISFVLNRNTKQVDFLYSGDQVYGFTGRFTNRSTEEALIYQVNCQNDYNGRIVRYGMVFDQADRMVSMIVNYNPDNGDDYWEFSSGFLNDTVIYAQLDTQHSGQLIQNGSVLLSLSNSRILTTKINWEPSWPEDLKAAVQNIISKMGEKGTQQREAMMTKWTALATRIATTRATFMMANMDLFTNAVLFKGQVAAQWTLNKPVWTAQRAHFMSMLSRFNTTIRANSFPMEAESHQAANERHSAEYHAISEYFVPNFEVYTEEMKTNWAEFVAEASRITEQFDGEAIAAHFIASDQAKNEFYEALFVHLDEDMAVMLPNLELFRQKCIDICDTMTADMANVKEQFMARIALLEADVVRAREVIAAIKEDIATFNLTLRAALVEGTNSIQAELEPFRHPDFSQLAVLRTEMRQNVEMILDQLKTQVMTGGGAFLTPYVAHILLSKRLRRQAAALPERSQTTVDIDAIKATMAQFNAKYTVPSIYPVVPEVQVSIPDNEVVVISETTSQVVPIVRAAMDVLKKIFNGTYEITKLDLANGEIIFKLFIKDFGNFSSLKNLTTLMNLTKPYLDMLTNNFTSRYDFTALRALRDMFAEGTSMSEYQARFQEQFTANRTEYEKIMRELQANIQETIETRVLPNIENYLEAVGNRIVERGRPFFGQLPEMPAIPDTSSFMDELTSQFDLSGLDRMMGSVKQTMCGAYNQVRNTMMDVKMAACPRTWMPPFKVNALVIGAEHYMTFDRQFYDFSGKCGYLLAKDFVHENDFSAVVDYEREMEIPIRNMMFMINGSTFEIKSDGSVRVNRQLRELPLQVDDTVVLRIGYSIWLKNAHGVTIVCTMPHDVCVLRLEGRYFDRTAGLLGNFNHEPFDDMMTPDNELLTNVTAFAESWKVGKNCIQPETSPNSVIPSGSQVVNFDPLHPDNQACASMFLDRCSSLAPCHSDVDPDTFYRMCVLDSRGVAEEDKKSKRCSIAMAYKTQCMFSNQRVGMPDTCLTCDFNDETFTHNEPITITEEEITPKVDIVFVVEEKRCAESVSQNLDDLVSRLAGELKKSGYNDTRFGLAAFGGSGVHDVAHQHTINHKIFNNETSEFVLGRDSLEFADDGSNDTFAAIRLAANYPFRAGVAKHIILLACSECNPDDTQMKFSDLSVMLSKRGISLTVLMDHQFSLRKEMSKTKSKSERIYGVDSTSVFTSKMATQEVLKGDRTLREFVIEPSNLCTLLAQETKGAIFDSSLLGSKGFDEVLVKQLVKHSVPEPCQFCRCVPDKMSEVGRSVCEKCVDPLNPLDDAIRGGIRDFELRYRLPHMRFADQNVEEEE